MTDKIAVEVVEEKKRPYYGGGRVKKEIPLLEVQRLASLLYTRQEISRTLDISLSVLEHNADFVDYYKRGRELAYHAVETSLYKSAIDGNVTAQIFLAKNYLGMSDKVDLRQKTENVTIVISAEDANL